MWRAGENHPRAKLTDHEVEMIRQLHEQGVSYRKLAKKFDVGKSTVSSICRYRRRGRVAMHGGKANA